MTVHSSILAWRIHGQRNLVGYIVHGVPKGQTQLSIYNASFPPPLATLKTLSLVLTNLFKMCPGKVNFMFHVVNGTSWICVIIVCVNLENSGPLILQILFQPLSLLETNFTNIRALEIAP